MMNRIPLTLKSFRPRMNMNRMTLYSSTALILGAGFYTFHSTQPTSTVIASTNDNKDIASYSKNELFHDYASSANTNKRFSRITIPSGKATVINYNPIDQQNDIHHILITVQGEGEVHYAPSKMDDTVIYGTDNNIIHKQLKLGNSVGIPSTNWHQIINKHETKDLILVVTSIPSNDDN